MTVYCWTVLRGLTYDKESFWSSSRALTQDKRTGRFITGSALVLRIRNNLHLITLVFKQSQQEQKQRVFIYLWMSRLNSLSVLFVKPLILIASWVNSITSENSKTVAQKTAWLAQSSSYLNSCCHMSVPAKVSVKCCDLSCEHQYFLWILIIDWKAPSVLMNVFSVTGQTTSHKFVVVTSFHLHFQQIQYVYLLCVVRKTVT